MKLSVMSFSYKHGLPDADYVFDARFLQNPHYVEGLSEHTGREKAVGEYIAADPLFAPFFEHACGMLLPLLPRLREKGREALTIAVGCTGGKHRSVYVAERLAAALTEAGFAVTATHRDVEGV